MQFRAAMWQTLVFEHIGINDSTLLCMVLDVFYSVSAKRPCLHQGQEWQNVIILQEPRQARARVAQVSR